MARDRMMLSLTFDHRIVDGAPAARFLQSLGLLDRKPEPLAIALTVSTGSGSDSLDRPSPKQQVADSLPTETQRCVATYPAR